jgi:hypothetical protein
MRNHDNFLGIYENCFDSEYCKKFIEHIDLLEERSIVLPTPELNHRVDDHGVFFSHDYNLKSWSWLGESFLPKIQHHVQNYMEKYSILMKSRFLMHDIKAKKIDCGGGFHEWHYENSCFAALNRILVVQLYLNTIEEGGETEFLYLNKRVNAEEGKILIFPAGFTHTHRGNPPINQTKYIVTTWVLLQEDK